MPSDANGVYSLPSGYLAVTGSTILSSQHNPPLEDLAAAMTGRLAVNGANPMVGPLRHADGAVSAPGMTFTSSPGSGFYKTTGGVGVAIAGVKVAEFVSSGLISGARFIGEMFAWTGSTAPALCVLPYGQTLSRTAYPDLWTFAQTEIAAGNHFYNNGNGTTTFGVGDLRGRVIAGKDDMGGVAAARLSAAYFGALSGNVGRFIGDVGGLESCSILTGNLPPYTPAGSNSSSSVSVTSFGNSVVTTGGGNPGLVGSAAIGTLQTTISSSGTANAQTFTGSAQGGTSIPLNNTQPTIVTQFALFAGA